MVRQPRRLAAVAIAILVGACGNDAPKEPAPKREPPPDKPKSDGVADKLAQHRAAYAYLQDTFAKRRHDGTRDELLAYLAEAYRKVNGSDGTLDERLAWLDAVYATAQDPSSGDPDAADPGAVFGVDVAGAMAGGQLEGDVDAPVTIVLAFDYG